MGKGSWLYEISQVRIEGGEPEEVVDAFLRQSEDKPLRFLVEELIKMVAELTIQMIIFEDTLQVVANRKGKTGV